MLGFSTFGGVRLGLSVLLAALLLLPIGTGDAAAQLRLPEIKPPKIELPKIEPPRIEIPKIDVVAPIDQPGCGAAGQKPCAANLHPLRCDTANLVILSGICRPLVPAPEQVSGCGAQGEEPCPITRAFPSCDMGPGERLVHNLLKGVCVYSRHDVMNTARDLVSQSAGLVGQVVDAMGTCAANQINRVIGLVNDNRVTRADGAAMIGRMDCVNEIIDAAYDAGYETVTIAIGGGASYFIGGDGELGFAFDTARKEPPRFYSTVVLSGGLQMGGSVGLVTGLFRSDNANIGGFAHGATIGAAAAGGSTAAVWLELFTGKPAGFSLMITAGAEFSASYGVGVTEVSGPLR